MFGFINQTKGAIQQDRLGFWVGTDLPDLLGWKKIRETYLSSFTSPDVPLERPTTPSVQLLSGRSHRSHSGCTERPPARGESVQECKQCYSVFLSAVLLLVELR